MKLSIALITSILALVRADAIVLSRPKTAEVIPNQYIVVYKPTAEVRSDRDVLFIELDESQGMYRMTELQFTNTNLPFPPRTRPSPGHLQRPETSMPFDGSRHPLIKGLISPRPGK